LGDVAIVPALHVPSVHQRNNLDRMTNFLGGNTGATVLAHDLWQFFAFRLACTRPRNAKCSRIRYGIKNYSPIIKPSDIAPAVLLAASDRMSEALTHELLHLEMLRIGYPKFYFDSMDADGAALAGGIQNCADHQVMLPLFLKFGFSADRFETPRKLSKRDQQRVMEIKALPNLSSPEGFADSVGGYLRENGFSFRLVHVRE
jgi:hypothetical protein